eukprot:CAMPEP_0180045234 /NCGR_PEP_ID=MMETSP0984-20121128/36352_1 /TAXON_ID=483367 /ORGANISM="non described non described, Strain CCMP 2436" /LENGTH=44 /DNA_ID= /DNA_START= /DNA_END= /DNA_ORIENTATION=
MGSAPSPRSDHSLVPIGNWLLVFGGFSNRVSASWYGSALHCFDL